MNRIASPFPRSGQGWGYATQKTPLVRYSPLLGGLFISQSKCPHSRRRRRSSSVCGWTRQSRRAVGGMRIGKRMMVSDITPSQTAQAGARNREDRRCRLRRVIECPGWYVAGGPRAGASESIRFQTGLPSELRSRDLTKATRAPPIRPA